MDNKAKEELERQNYKYGYKKQKKTLKDLYRAAFAIACTLAVVSMGNFYIGHLNTQNQQQHQANITVLQQQIASLAKENNQIKQQLQDETLEHRKTEDRRYLAQHQLNRKNEKIAQMQGSTKEARAMLDQVRRTLEDQFDRQ